MADGQRSDPEKIKYLKRVREAHIDPMSSHPLYRSFLDFLGKHEDDPHYPRFAQTMTGLANFLGDFVLANPQIAICETGGLSVVSQFFLEQGFNVKGTKTDLRYAIDAEDNTYDVILSLEVFEHIKDQNEKSFDDIVLFNGSGARKYAEEIFRTLKNRGVLILTTPNPTSLWVLNQIMAYNAPTVFRGHVREYTKIEILETFKDFELMEYRTFFSYFFLESGPNLANDLAGKVGWDPKDRGDCHFFIFQKP